MAITKRTVAQSLFLLSGVVACTTSPPTPSPQPEPLGSVRSEVFANGDFESGTNGSPPPSWTVHTYLNGQVTIQTPQTRAGLNLQTGGVALTRTLVTAAGPGSQPDADLGAAASFRWPRYGNAVAIVNQHGNAKNVNSMLQQMTVADADVDATDGLAHVRFVLAPVLQDPGHPAEQQPYFFLQLRNLTKNTTLYQDFNFSNQAGVPWKQNAAGDIKYTDWALVDIAPGSAKLAPGDLVELEIIAAGCSRNAHWGEVYVDGVGTALTSLFVSATGPSAANENTNITYTLAYKNGSASAANGVVLDFNTPPNTTFQSLTTPAGFVCTTPAAGATGLVHCTRAAALPAGAGGTFTITTHIDNNVAPTTITAGNYSIAATGVSPLLGPKVYTDVTSGVAYADVRVSIPQGATSVAAGGAVSYTINVDNAGPSAANGATVSNPVPAQIQNATWTCAATGGAVCPAASGTGAINATVATLPSGGHLTYTFSGTVNPAAAAGQLADVATVTVPGSVTDPAPNDDSVANYKKITVANGVTCAVNGDCTSGVCFSDNKCGIPQGSGTCTAGNGATVCRTGACSTNGTCVPVGGCNADADCSGGKWCSVATHTCTAKLPNGTAIPNDPGHTNPTLNGQCSGQAGALTCVSGVCDLNDDECGFPNGVGPCTSGNAATVCRSGACSQNHTCRPVNGCNVDSDCSAVQWCNVSTHTCTAKLPNNTAVPTDAAHTNPTLNGKCSAQVGALTCQSGVCDTKDDKCGLADGDGLCTIANGGTVCRSGACSLAGTCRAPTGCNADGDCASTQWCNISTHTCSAKLANDTPIPTDAAHTNPTLNGQCSAQAGMLTCQSGVCDLDDDKCGFPNGKGPCTDQNAATVCRSGTCGIGGTCKPAGGCNVDADCAAGKWCMMSTNTCTDQVPNGGSVPTDQAHTSPVLDGQCNQSVGILTCVSGVCDLDDDKCGFPDGKGPCTVATGPTVCRSGSCSGTTSTCKPVSGCNVDADCAATEWCNIGSHVCTAKLANGSAIPNDPPHTNPTLNGTCTDTAGAAVCASAVCDTSDNECGFADGKGPCTTQNGGTVCRSGTCGSSGVCVGTGGCTVDTDCNHDTQFCDTGAHRCTEKLPNGTLVPTIANHTPPLTGICNPDVGAAVCAAGVCDTVDNKCGLANAQGPCTVDDRAKVCRSGTCDPTDGKCGLADGDGPCASGSDCRSANCNATTKVCGAGCKTDGDCDPADYCSLPDGKCIGKMPDGDSCAGDNQCISNACHGQVCDVPRAEGNGFGCATTATGSLPSGGGLATFGMSFILASLIGRRRGNRSLP